MAGHFGLEQRANQYLSEQRETERKRREDILWEVSRAIGTEKLPGEYPDKFIEELRQTPPDWKVDVFEEGIRFLRDFPYETYFYDMRGWDAARLVVNLDVAKSAVAFRFHAFDSESDVTIDEGILVENGRVVSFEEETSGTSLYIPHLRGIQRVQVETKGESGCIIDHLGQELDQLPVIVKGLSSESHLKFLASFLRRVEAGEIDVNTMPRLTLVWPLLQPYHAAAE